MNIKTKLKQHEIKQGTAHVVITTDEGDCVAELHIGGNRWPEHKVTFNNARRLVACWNACAGIPTEMIESVDPDHQPAIYAVQAKRIAELEQQVIALKGGEVANANAH